MKNILKTSKILDNSALPCSCGCEDLSYLLYQTEQGELWAVGCNNCGFEIEPETRIQSVALELWNAKTKPKTQTSGKAQTRAQNKYIQKRYDRINLTVEKGEKDILKAHADIYDEGSVNAFINRAIKETMARDKERK